MRRACIDIGSNTTRLLVAESHGGRLQTVHQARAFTRIGRGIAGDGTIASAKIAEVVAVVCEQVDEARRLGARDVRAVATAAIRHAANGDELAHAVEAACGVPVQILSGEEEARLAFIGAAGTLARPPEGSLGVVDVGGGSSEIVVGAAPSSVNWSSSIALGSGDLAEACLHSDPPRADELAAARARVAAELGGVSPPAPSIAVAVGGSATSVCRLAGTLLDRAAFERAFAVLSTERAAVVAGRFSIDPQRVRLLPAGLMILEAVSGLFGIALVVGSGGLREGVLLAAG